MGYTLGALRKSFGKKIRDDREYLIDTHRGAETKIGAGTHTEIGKVPDGSLNEDGTMVVLETAMPKGPLAEKVRAAVASTLKNTKKGSK